MTQTELDELKKLCEAATPGPWRFGLDTPSTGYLHANKVVLGEKIYVSDGNFIAAAREAVPKLIEALEKHEAFVLAMAIGKETVENSTVFTELQTQLADLQSANASLEAKLTELREKVTQVRTELLSARNQLLEAREVIEVCLPIIEETFWDYYTAFSLPGSGFNNKGQYKAGHTFGGGWKSEEGFESFIKKARAYLAKFPQSSTSDDPGGEGK